MKGVQDAIGVRDATRPRDISVSVRELDRPSGPRSFVHVHITEGSHAGDGLGVHLEPEQARRLAELLEHGADMADREPVGIMRKLVEQLAYFDGSGSMSAAELERQGTTKTLDDARAWLERHGAGDA